MHIVPKEGVLTGTGQDEPNGNFARQVVQKDKFWQFATQVQQFYEQKRLRETWLYSDMTAVPLVKEKNGVINYTVPGRSVGSEKAYSSLQSQRAS